MEPQVNNISSQAKLSAIAGMMFFAPFIKKSMSTSSFSDNEKEFISWYIRVWYFNLWILVIVAIAAILDLVFISQIASLVANIGSLVIYVVLLFTIFACANDVNMRWSNESIKQNIQYKDQILKVYLPIKNFSIRYSQSEYNTPYRWLKESTLLWIIFIFWTLLLGNSVGIWIAITIAVRVILLLLNIDIVPLSIKRAINSIFLCNPGEIMAYITAPIIVKLKKYDYETVLNSEKLKYAQWQTFGIWIVLQYLLFFGILFLCYRWIEISPYYIVLLVAIIMRFIRVMTFYRHKWTFLRIPILSEIVWLVFR